ncbi:hypothetical protein RvY_13781 [Ramazzottius varieornatus]|uniref:Uncharacterized protein n=1 Tax=Ramazzottius varieornatus TaxID=947166 RepID=A0A1D1VQV8_RAMVA|nr:hypothetical protein RvY_13781 [Ramazzottius varieornatus]
METAGIFVGSLSITNGILALTLWKTSRRQPKLWLLRLHKSLCNFNLCCALAMFCLSLVALGILTTLRDWQKGVAPLLVFHDDLMKFFKRADLTFPYEYLEELTILRGMSMSFHLLIFLTSLCTSLFCLFNLCVAGLPNFGGIAESVSSFGSVMSNFSFVKRSSSKSSIA